MNIFTTDPEMTTALTDVLIAIVSLFGYYSSKKIIANRNEKLSWKLFYIFLVFAGLFGFTIHGIKLDAFVIDILWKTLSFIFCIVVTLLLFASVFKLNSKKIKKKYFIIFSFISLLIYIFMFIMASLGYDFLKLYIFYVGFCLLLIVMIYIYLYFKRKEKNMIYFIIAILLQLIGGLILLGQSTVIKVIWLFDFNSIYHIFLVFTLLLFIYGNKIVKKD